MNRPKAGRIKPQNAPACRAPAIAIAGLKSCKRQLPQEFGRFLLADGDLKNRSSPCRFADLQQEIGELGQAAIASLRCASADGCGFGLLDRLLSRTCLVGAIVLGNCRQNLIALLHEEFPGFVETFATAGERA